MVFWRKWRKRKADAAPVDAAPAVAAHEGLLELAGRRTAKSIAPVIGMSVLELADANGIDFASHCRRGTCARCRCKIEAGSECLSEPNEAETERLLPEELSGGFRLGCQARVTDIGPMRIRHAPYF